MLASVERLGMLIMWHGALFYLFVTSASVDTIAGNLTVRDGDTIVSAADMFELGFFSPGESTNRYVGIWYKQISPRTVVWVANRATPLTNTSGVFKVNGEGILMLLSGGGTVVWSSDSSRSPRNIDPVAQLLDNGNLVVRDKKVDQGNFIWQSFDHPGDTLLPGMKFGKDFVTGMDKQLTSWRSLDDPSPGLFTTWMDTNGFPQIFVREGSVLRTRFGPWNGLRFDGMPTLRKNPSSVNVFVFNQEEIYFGYELVNSSLVSRVYFNPEGSILRLNWIDQTQSWFPILVPLPADSCAPYGLCGPYGSCSINNFPVCSCMQGFEPRLAEEWNGGNWSGGCQRKQPLDCRTGDGFLKSSGMKFPDTRRSWYNLSMTLDECETACKMNCSCTAYANLDIRKSGSGCLLWFNDLMDVRDFNEAQDIYIRMAASELTALAVPVSGSNKNKEIIRATMSSSVGLVLVALTLVVYVWNKKRRSCTTRQGNPVQSLNEDYTNESHKEDAELLAFSLSRIAKCTSNFSINNKLGEGGFGLVYKGVLADGQEIAVKRLSRTSRQGVDEFTNEVRCIARLQHRNLVRLLGYYIQGDEIMLIYEYMANKSLDLFIFDETERTTLDWAQRFHIIHGIARGLLYLHQDSRLRIIHRDLKAGNILLDDEMNPKISDFGLARRFRGYETGDKTNKVVGTYGYISPEYAMQGHYSVKSDVFSFGVLVLEIVSGKKNREFFREEHNDNLLGHVVLSKFQPLEQA